jgi:hypothetical protein
VHVESSDVSAMGSGPEVVLLVMVVIALRGYSALYFATRYDKWSPAVVALVGFVFLIDVLSGSVYYASCVAERAVTCGSVVRSLLAIRRPPADRLGTRSGGRRRQRKTRCASVTWRQKDHSCHGVRNCSARSRGVLTGCWQAKRRQT